MPSLPPERHSRTALLLAYDDEARAYLPHAWPEVDQVMAQGHEGVSATFAIPYPPGFPSVVPGQVVSRDILDFLRRLDVEEIHRLRPELGVRAFREEALRHGAVAWQPVVHEGYRASPFTHVRLTQRRSRRSVP